MSPTRSATTTRRAARPIRCRPAPVSIAVALADKLDQLACFFAIDEKPTGAGDPYALRRAALGVIRIIRENGLRLQSAAAARDAVAAARRRRTQPRRDSECPRAKRIRSLAVLAGANASRGDGPVPGTDPTSICASRSWSSWPSACACSCAPRAPPRCADAVFAAGADDDITRLLRRTDAVTALLRSRRRRQPADRLPPRRQHPADRGAQGRPAFRRADPIRLLSGTAEIDLDHALAGLRCGTFGCSMRNIRRGDGRDGKTARAAGCVL